MLKKAYRTILAQFWLLKVLKTEIIEESVEILINLWLSTRGQTMDFEVITPCSKMSWDTLSDFALVALFHI